LLFIEAPSRSDQRSQTSTENIDATETIITEMRNAFFVFYSIYQTDKHKDKEDFYTFIRSQTEPYAEVNSKQLQFRQFALSRRLCQD